MIGTRRCTSKPAIIDTPRKHHEMPRSHFDEQVNLIFSFKSPALNTSVPVASASVALCALTAAVRDFASLVPSAISTPEKVRAIKRYGALNGLIIYRAPTMNF